MMIARETVPRPHRAAAKRAAIEQHVDGPLSPAQHAALRIGGAAALAQARACHRERDRAARLRQAVATAAAARQRQAAEGPGPSLAAALVHARVILVRELARERRTGLAPESQGARS